MPRSQAVDSELDIETRLYERPSGIQRITPSRVLAVQKPDRRRRLGLTRFVIPDGGNVFLMPRSAADPLPPWAKTLVEVAPAPRVVRKRSRLSLFLFLLTFAIAFAFCLDPRLRHGALVRLAPLAPIAKGVVPLAHRAVDFTVREWRALR